MKPKETQAQRILRRLKQEGELTNVQLIEMHILRGAARIEELRQAGHPIESIRVKGGVWKYKYIPPANPEMAYSHVPGRPYAQLKTLVRYNDGSLAVTIEKLPELQQASLDLGDVPPPLPARSINPGMMG